MNSPSHDPPLSRGRALGAASALGGGRLIGMLGSAAVTLLLTGKLQPAEYGALGLAFALQSLLMTVSIAGMRSALVRELCVRPAERPLVRASYLATAATLGWSAAAVTALVIAALPLGEDERRLYFLMLWGHVAAILDLGPLFDAAGRQTSAAAIGVIGDLVYLAGVVTLWSNDALALPAIGFCLALRPWAVLMLQALTLPLGPAAFCGGSRREAARLLASGGWIALGQAASIWPLTGSVFLVRTLANPTDSGLFSLAAYIAAAYLGVAYVISRVVQPLIASPQWREPSYRRSMIAFYVAFVLGLGTAAVVGAVTLFQFFFPVAYRGAREPALILIAAAAAQGLAELSIILLIHRRAERRVFVTWLLILPPAIGAAAWFAQSSSLVGVAAAILGGNLVLLAAMTVGATRSTD